MSHLEHATCTAITSHQFARLRAGLTRVLASNLFYQTRLAGLSVITLQNLEDLAQPPFTTKQELMEDQEAHPLFGTNLTYPLSKYICLHQTSGTSGHPMKQLDTRESWDWWADCWNPVYRAAGVNQDDIIFLAFGFGPFIGFWSAHEGAKRLGALAISGGSKERGV